MYLTWEGLIRVHTTTHPDASRVFAGVAASGMGLGGYAYPMRETSRVTFAAHAQVRHRKWSRYLAHRLFLTVHTLPIWLKAFVYAAFSGMGFANNP